MTTKEMARQTNPPRLAHWKMSLVFVTLVAIALPTVLHGAVRDIIDFEAFEDPNINYSPSPWVVTENAANPNYLVAAG